MKQGRILRIKVYKGRSDIARCFNTRVHLTKSQAHICADPFLMEFVSPAMGMHTTHTSKKKRKGKLG